MFDRKVLPKTPSVARRVLAFSQLNNMVVDQKLVELANQDLLTSEAFKGFPFRLSPSALKAVQHVLDWNGRSMILDNGDMTARDIVLASQWIKPTGKVIILARPQTYGIWAQKICEVWTDAKISVFGNPRYEDKDQVYPEGVEFTVEPDLNADWLITSYGSLIWNNLLGTFKTGQVYIEELSETTSINYRWQEALQGVFREIMPITIIQNINDLAKSEDAMTALQMPNSHANTYISELLTSYLWPHSTTNRALSTDAVVQSYLQQRKYHDFDVLHKLPLFGVSTSMLDQMGRGMNFFDTTIKNLNKQRRQNREMNLSRIVKREEALEAQTGQPVGEIVRAALDQHEPSMTLLGGLRTVQWANLKAQTTKRYLDQFTSRMTRTLLFSQSKDLSRSLNLATGSLELAGIDADAQNTRLARYLHPHESWRKYASEVPPQLNSLIVGLEQLENNDLLEATNFLVLVDPPRDRETFDALKALTEQFGIRLVQIVLQGTFEEQIFDQLNQ